MDAAPRDMTKADAPQAPDTTSTPVAAPAPVTAPTVATLPTASPTVATPAQPVSRRARRLQTGEQPVVDASAETAAVAPASTTPSAPATPVIVEAERPAAAAERPAAPAERPAAPAERPAADSASTWMAETIAKLMAAEASVTAGAVEKRVAEASVTAQPEVVAEAQLAAAEPILVAPVIEPKVETTAAEPKAEAPRATETPRPSRDRTQRPRAERVEPQADASAEATASGVDEFEAAARLFSFTGETPVQQPAAAADDAEEKVEAQPAAHTAPRRVRRGSAFKRVATASFSVGVFGIVGLMAVGMTTPAEAVAAVTGSEEPLSVMAVADSSTPVIDEEEIQAYVAPGDAQVDTLDRNENYATVTTAQLASEAGIRNFSNLFHNDPTSNIQWPFAVGVPISYGFGMRPGGMHRGVDFTPGSGSPIQAIADGTVRIASEAGGEFGVHVMIDHIIDGQLVSSHYAHMQYGSLAVTQGQHVTVGQLLGRTGNTGRSYGAHTHFEILMNGTTRIDPMPWLRTYTDGTHTVG